MRAYRRRGRTVKRIAAGGLAAAFAFAAPARAQPEDDSPRARIEAVLAEGADKALSGDWDAAEEIYARVAEIDPGHPAAPYYLAAIGFRRAHEDEANPKYEERTVGRLRRAIELAEERADADDEDADALLYWGAALADLGRAEAVRGDFYAAGRDAESGRKLLERALEKDPSLVDANCPLGAALYTAGLLPDAVKALDFLWFVPKGSREEGLRRLRVCADKGRAGGAEGLWLLFSVLARYEPDGAAEAVRIGAALRERAPRNAALHVDYARALLHKGDFAAAATEADNVAERAFEKARGYDGRIAALATFWRARAFMNLRDYAGARATLALFGEEGPPAPLWMRAWTLVTLGQLADLEGKRAEALAHYGRVGRLQGARREESAAAEAERRIEEPYRTPTP